MSQSNTFSYLFSGCEDDDRGGNNIRGMLASVPFILYYDIDIPHNYRIRTHSRNIPGHLLVGDEQFHVQSDNLLLDECQVRVLLIASATEWKSFYKNESVMRQNIFISLVIDFF